MCHPHESQRAVGPAQITSPAERTFPSGAPGRLAKCQGRGAGWGNTSRKGSCREVRALRQRNLPALSIRPPPREAAAGRSTWHVSAARCVRPRPRPRRAPAGLVTRVRPDFRTPSRPPARRTLAAVRGASPDKGRKASLAATLPLRRPRPRTSGPASPANPAPRRAPGGPRRRPKGHRLQRVAEV